MKGFEYGMLVLAVWLHLSPSRAEACKPGPPLVVSVTTIDGSSLTGLVERNAREPARLEGARLVPWERIRTVAFADGRQEAQITLQDNEEVRGRIVSEDIQMTTVVGRLAVPWDKVVELRVDPQREIPAELATKPLPRGPIRFQVTLDDGSWVLGTPDTRGTRVESALGTVDVPWARVRRIEFHDDRETCTLELWNGDKLVGCVAWKAVAVSTGLGDVHVCTVHTKSIALSLGGVDLVATPYASASGDRHFLGAIQADRPKQIRGRMVPPSQFIEAHAGGRLEFVFDEPVSEFHATLAMYESYSATKGSVIFKLQTDEGEVFASRLIRNMQHEEVYVRFPPTRKLVLITDPNGSNQEDWSVWLRPEAR